MIQEKSKMDEYIRKFKEFNDLQKAYVINSLNQYYCKLKFEEMSKALPDTDISEEEVMAEVRAVRYGKD